MSEYVHCQINWHTLQ